MSIIRICNPGATIQANFCGRTVLIPSGFSLQRDTEDMQSLVKNHPRLTSSPYQEEEAQSPSYTPVPVMAQIANNPIIEPPIVEEIENIESVISVIESAVEVSSMATEDIVTVKEEAIVEESVKSTKEASEKKRKKK
jgi:hypothetical protein